MSLPGNGIFVVQGEMAMLVTAMRRSTRWSSHSFPNEEYDVLMRTFQDLKSILHQVEDLRLLDPSTYLSPFLEVIRSKETTGPVTSLALSAINKFLSYGLIDPTHSSVPATVEDIADAVTHARFVGTDHSSDGVVLMKILQVLRTLMLSPEGAMLTDESVCEIMLSCFRICFETRLTELLRRNAEQCLRDMTQLIFMRLPQFPPEGDTAANFAVGLSLKKRDKSKKKSISSVHSTNSLERKPISREMASPVTVEADPEANKVENLTHSQDKHLINEEEITISPGEPLKSKKHARHSSMDLADNGNTSISQLLEKCVTPEEGEKGESESKDESQQPDGACISQPLEDKENPEKMEEYVNQRGIRFTPQEDTLELQPYGLVCVRELFRFLISLCNPLDPQNTSAMVHLGLCLVGTSLEVASDHLADYPSLLELIKDPLCRSLLSLLSTERISIFALDLQVSFLLFEALRYHLKYQMEAFFKKMIEIVSSDTSKAIYELKEIQHIAIESLIQLFKIPGLCTELYLNYDCDVYCMNVFEELTKLLSKNVVSQTAYNIHTLSLEALLTIIEAIEAGISEKNDNECEKNELDKNESEKNELGKNDNDKYGRGGHISLEMGGMDDASVMSDHVTHDISQYFGGRRRPKVPVAMATEAELDNIRNMKQWVTQGTELFNQKPERGIEFLQEHGVLTTPLDPHQVAMFLRENPDLDKKMIGEYICKRSSRDEDEDGGPSVLSAFADSFDYTGLRIEQALRLYLETFRLPGEAPLIFLVMERFAERWHSTNGEPFANTDAAFRLAYAVIMLNMDQHNHNAKKLNVPMTVEDFVKNLRECNGSGDFDQAMLEEVYYAIKNEEMVMPAERTGPVRDAYLWRVLQRRGRTAPAYRAPTPRLAPTLLPRATPTAVTALSAAFERASPPTTEEIESNNTRDSIAVLAMAGLERCASLLARYPIDGLSVDSLLLTLCKFTSLLSHQNNYIATGVSLGQSSKAQLALQKVFSTVALHADSVSQTTWTRVLQLVGALYVGRLLPKSLVEVEDYLAPEGKVSLIRQAARGDAGLFSSIYSYIALGESGIRAPTPHEKALIDIAADCVEKCNIPAVLVTETKFMQADSLQELIQAMVEMTTPPDAESLQENPELEDLMIFYLELLAQTLIQNRDRPAQVCPALTSFSRCVLWSPSPRPVGTALRALAGVMRAHACVPAGLACLCALLRLPRNRRAAASLPIAYGLYDIIKTSAQNIHTESEWRLVLQLLCAVGAGAWPETATPSNKSDGSEEEERRPTSVSSESELSSSPQTQGWIWVADSTTEGPPPRAHSAAALARCCEALALIVRDVAHVTPHNLRHAVRAVRLCAAAHNNTPKPKSSESRKSRRRGQDESSDEDSDTLDQYHLISIQLLDLMHTLHSRTAQIFKWWQDEADQDHDAKEYDLWEVAWKPLLQGIAQFCTDKRKQIANTAIAYLQRALLAPGLCAVSAAAWHECFARVLFPLVHAARNHPAALRTNTILCKVFLQHLSALSSQASFPALWARVVHTQRGLVRSPAEGVTEAAQESLKNMILVMDSVRIFRNEDGYNELWYQTWEQVGAFLPTLKEELFPAVKDDVKPGQINQTQPTVPNVTPVGQNSTPSIIPQPTLPQTTPILPQTTPYSPQTSPNIPQSMANKQNVSNIHSPMVAPVPMSGMVPIRNQLYDTPGLTSSVLLQPLNEMVSTPIGISIHKQMPILYPQTNEENKINPNTPTIQPTIPSQTVLDINYDNNVIPDNREMEHGELYAEYLTNPYTETKELSAKEATLYDPGNKDQSIPQHLIIDQKSLSANTTPMHTRNKAQFGSTDNVRPDSGIFDYSSYFSGGEVKGDVFDAILSSQEG